MGHFYTFKVQHLKRWFVVIILALFTATFLWFEQTGTFLVFSSNNSPSDLTKGNKNEPNIALTFNISWGEEKVYDILKELEKNDVQATFFISGEWAERHPEILEAISDAEHEIGMLGYRYTSYLDQDIDQVKKDLEYAKKIFTKLGYEDMTLLRPPSGQFNKEILNLVEDAGLEVIHWNVNPADWKNPGTDTIIDYVMNETENGDIILMHASDTVEQTAEALKIILKGLKNKEFQFVPISELINQAHAESKNIN